MGKNIVVCIGGTSDFAAKNPTHVFRLFRALERFPNQTAYYDGGIGTLRETAALTVLWKELLLAVATSIHKSFDKAFRFLVRNYEDGDMIFLFGFSRGAYTVRALAGAIRLFGVLRTEQEYIVPYVWQEFSRMGDDDDKDE